MDKQIRIATRSSALALAQVDEVIRLLPGNYSVIHVSTESGDLNQQDPLYQMGSVGVFTKQVEDYLLQNKADVAVHSLKDLPTIIDPRLDLIAYTKLQDRSDVIVLSLQQSQKLSKVKSLEELPHGFKLGTSSLRRITSIRNIRPDFQLENIRGNLQTRLRKLDEGLFDGIVLAKAGLLRLGLEQRISFDLDLYYAPAQGALGIQCRKDDILTIEFMKQLNDIESEYRCTAERQFLNLLEGGCKLPIAVKSQLLPNHQVYLQGRVYSTDGAKYVEAEATDQFDKVGRVLSEIIIQMGGRDLLQII